MNILALDIATKTGWAYRINGRILSGVQDFSLKRGDSPGMRFVRFAKWLEEFASWEDVCVVYEEPHHGKGGSAVQVLFGLLGHLTSFCAIHGFEHTAVKTKELKKYATGKGNAKKEDMIATANELLGAQGSDPTKSDDEADAICLLNYAEKVLF